MKETKLHSDDIEQSNQKLLGMYFILDSRIDDMFSRELSVIQLLLEESFKVSRLPSGWPSWEK